MELLLVPKSPPSLLPNILIYFFSDSPVYTPDDGDYWRLAKLNVQVTDFAYAQIVEHLAKVFNLEHHQMKM